MSEEKAVEELEELETDTKLESFVPRTGLVYSEKTSLSPVLCKPKLMPIKPAHVARREREEDDET